MSRALLAGLLFLGACGPPVYRIPGPTGGLGQGELPGNTPRVAEGSSTADEPTERIRRGSKRHGEAVARAAEELLGQLTFTCNGVSYRGDCSGMVNAAHAMANIDVGIANTAMLGSTLLPEMYERGYRPSIAIGPRGLGAGRSTKTVAPSRVASSFGRRSVSIQSLKVVETSPGSSVT